MLDDLSGVKCFMIFDNIVDCGNILVSCSLTFGHLKFVANIVYGSGSLIGRILPLSSATQNGLSQKLFPSSLSPLQVLYCIDVHFASYLW